MILVYKQATYLYSYHTKSNKKKGCDIDAEITNKVNNLIKELSEKENVNEELKDKDQMKWVGLMNNIKNRAEEIVLREYIEV